MVGVQVDGDSLLGEQQEQVSNTNIDPGFWSLDNFGQNLIATVHNGRSFQWTPISRWTLALTNKSNKYCK
jgi:hypothetical protein